MKRIGLAALVLALLAGNASAKRDRTLVSDALRASKMLAEDRLDDAEHVITELQARVGDEPEVRWLRAELAFNRSDYLTSLTALTGLPDDAVSGQVGDTRKRAVTSLAVTSTFLHRSSSHGHFIIDYPPGPDEVIAELAGDVLEAAYTALGTDLGATPTKPVHVEILSSPLDLAKLSPLTETDIETTGTIALSKYGKLMVVSPRATLFGYPWMDTLAHEYTHLVVSESSHDSVPVWLQEGLARFEQTRWREDAPAAGKTPELSPAERQLLSSRLRKGRLVTLDEMYPSMAKLPSQEAAATAYAEVLTLVAWIHGKVGYAGLRDIIAAQRDGKSTHRAIADVVGGSFEDTERAWKQSLWTLDLTGGHATNRPIRFAQGGKKDEDVGLDHVANPKARKFARLAGMLRARGQNDGAAVEYEKALAAGGSDPLLAGKLARTLVELGRFDKAVELATPLLTIDDSDPVPAVTVGMAQQALHVWPLAQAAFEQALRVSPFDPAVRCGLAEVYAQLKNPAATRELKACQLLRQTTP